MKIHNHSVWLRFDKIARAELMGLIDEFAAPEGAPVFEPHVTLIGDIPGNPQKTAKVCEEVFSELSSLTATVVGVDRTAAFFMSLFLDLKVSDQLNCAREHVQQMLGVEQFSDFRPHVSLAYGLGEGAVSAQRIAALDAEFSNRSLGISTISVMASAKSIPIPDWHCLFDVAL